MTSAFLALQLWLGKPAKEFDYLVVPFDKIFEAVKSGKAVARELTWDRCARITADVYREVLEQG